MEKDQKIVILGGSGFVGSEAVKLYNNIIESLEKNENLNKFSFLNDNDMLVAHKLSKTKIIILDIVESKLVNHRVEYMKCDLDSKEFRDFVFLSTDIIIHLAAKMLQGKISLKDMKSHFQFNIDIMNVICEKMQNAGAKNIIYFSTDMVYGAPKYLPVDEAHPTNPFGEYGSSKLQSEKILQEFVEKFSFNASIFRPRMIIGAGRMGILTKLFKLIRLNLPVPLIGNGKNCYQMISVLDCAKAVIKSMLVNNATKHSLNHSSYLNYGGGNLELNQDLESKRTNSLNVVNAVINLGSKNPPQVKDLLNEIIKYDKSRSFLVPTHAASIKFILSSLEKLHLPLMYKEQYSIADEHYMVDISNCKKIFSWEPQDNDIYMMKEAFKEYKNIEKKK